MCSHAPPTHVAQLSAPQGYATPFVTQAQPQNAARMQCHAHCSDSPAGRLAMETALHYSGAPFAWGHMQPEGPAPSVPNGSALAMRAALCGSSASDNTAASAHSVASLMSQSLSLQEPPPERAPASHHTVRRIGSSPKLRAAELGRELALSEQSTQHADECMDAAAGTRWCQQGVFCTPWHDVEQAPSAARMAPALPAGW